MLTFGEGSIDRTIVVDFTVECVVWLWNLGCICTARSQ